MHLKFFTLPNSLLLKQGEYASSNNNVGAYPYPLLSLSPYSTWFSLLITLNTNPKSFYPHSSPSP